MLTQERRGTRMARPVSQEPFRKSWAALKDLLHVKLVNRIDLHKLATITDPNALRQQVRLVVERLIDTENPLINRMERERLIREILDDAFGFGALERLFRDDAIQEIRVEGPDKLFIRRQDQWEPAETWFRSLEQLYLICGRLLSAALKKPTEPGVNTVIERELPNHFQMAARFPATRLVPPSLHFRRLRAPAPPADIPVASRSRREQQLLIRFLKALYEAGLDNFSRFQVPTLRRIAEQVVAEFLQAENEATTQEERTRLVETIMDEALRG